MTALFLDELLEYILDLVLKVDDEQFADVSPISPFSARILDQHRPFLWCAKVGCVSLLHCYTK